ncbi:HvfC family RiPP maturation protein [Luteimonas aquatica]|uniref:HvfC family RiPP maturation protein n=1 Tax=Luteimonas aquatica TaxID=450364 RepID=UPI001F56AB37|nr:putative DNA-binding domain-containing protein [Luteimonas aquatica]
MNVLPQQQDALAAYIRDPDRVPPPPGIEPRRLKIYRELFFNNIAGLLAGNFPVLRRIYGETGWTGLVRAFYRDHGCRTPLFPELPREFLRYLEAREAGTAPADPERADPPWLRELAHYEWVELALQISEAAADIAHEAGGDLLAGQPVLSPLAWPLAYAWPVNRIGPDHLPDAPPAQPTLLLLRRERDGKVSFHALSPLTYRLLQRLDLEPTLSGREQLRALAAEAGAQDIEAFEREGAAMLARLREEGTVLGTRVHAPGESE